MISQMDWLSNIETKNKHLDMTMDIGRDETLISKKGLVLVKKFSDVEDIRKEGGTDLGPGNSRRYCFFSCFIHFFADFLLAYVIYKLRSHCFNMSLGAYDVTTGRGIADRPVNGVPFALAIPRNQLVGPKGEKPGGHYLFLVRQSSSEIEEIFFCRIPDSTLFYVHLAC